MNKVWTFCTIAALALLIIVAPQQFPSVIAASATQTVDLVISLCGIYCIWMGLINIAKNSGLLDKLAKLIKPLCGFLFGNIDETARQLICTSLCANMIGISNAATPSAIKAIQHMDKGSETATKAMIMLFVLNATSLQLIPTTIIGLRAAANSQNAADIVAPILITTFFTTIIAVILVKVFVKDKPNKENLQAQPSLTKNI